jgi:predicted nucleic acid-binding protein
LKTLVLDSWPVLEWIVRKSAAGARFEQLLEQAEVGDVILLMSAINVGEVYYFLRKQHDAGLANHWREASRALPIRVVVPAERDIWAAAELKGACPISYADAFAAELALRHHCALVTGDAEFRSVPSLKLEWLERA